MRDNLGSIKCAVAFGAFMLLALASSANAKEVYTGTVIGVGGPLGGVSRPFTLEINSYTSKAESSRAVAVLAEGGQDRLLKEFEGRRTFRLRRRSEEHTSELQSRRDLVCRLLLEKKKYKTSAV